MRIILTIVLAISLLSSCTIYKDVEVKEVRDVRVTKLGQEGVEAEIDVKLYNPNGYKVKVVSVNADLYVNDKDVGDAKLRQRVVLGKKSNEIHTIKLEGDYSELNGGILELLLGGLFSNSLNFKVDGTMKGKALMVGKSFYFKVDQDVKLKR